MSDRPELIESIDLVLPSSFAPQGMLPATTTSLTMPFEQSSWTVGSETIESLPLQFVITLHAGWEWSSPQAVNSTSGSRGRRDRMAFTSTLDFGTGFQSLRAEDIRKVVGDVDEITESVQDLTL